jgi:hypothetical protein|nr:MAG TPA: hypothetical protein [Caudoviricetes sp.]
MKKTLLDKVSIEKLDMLVDSLSEVMSEMRNIEKDKEKRYRDDAYCAGLTFSNMILVSLKRRVKKQQVNRLYDNKAVSMDCRVAPVRLDSLCPPK